MTLKMMYPSSCCRCDVICVTLSLLPSELRLCTRFLNSVRPIKSVQSPLVHEHIAHRHSTTNVLTQKSNYYFVGKNWLVKGFLDDDVSVETPVYHHLQSISIVGFT
ncbi:hypothetical protein QVD17_23081 [Tagetes erecta]|uniref:Uncharacterized protein n=1 Tax=Tagetes erecta TaxID=13708 RepID=A0AAD8KH65_TARER|nr:hypothetical protein QVD17_23081 [Tagetes erecta]